MKNILITFVILSSFGFINQKVLAHQNVFKPPIPPAVCYIDKELGRICVTRIRDIKKK